MASITFRCGRCQSKDQTADILHCEKYRQKTPYHEKQQPYLVLLCRKCKRSSSVYCEFKGAFPLALERFKIKGSNSHFRMFEEEIDVTGALRGFRGQTPSATPDMAGSIPEAVREACLDASDARTPRAKCQSYRSAVEFALREAGIAKSSGSTLGGILREASKTSAISDPLIELCDQVKAFGNWGLHWSETEIESADAEVAKSITFAILDYLFVLPEQVAQAKARTDAAQQNHKTSNSISGAKQ